MFLILVCMIICSVQIKINFQKNIVRIAAGLFCMMTSFLVLYFPNIMQDHLGGQIHLCAYITSIIGNADLQPYSEIFYSIYGHYGLFFIVPVRLLQAAGFSQLFAIIFCIALSGAVFMACLIYVAHKLIYDNGVFLLTAITLLLPFTTCYISGEYYQLYPHRFVFPAVMTALSVSDLSLIQKKITSILVLILAFLWNIETAAVCLVAYAGYEFLILLKEKRFVQAFFQVFVNVSAGIGAFLSSYGITNLYNKICGGRSITILRYVYPFFSEDYKIFDMLRTPINDISNIWFIEMFLFVMVTAFAFIWVFACQDEPRDYPYLFMLSLTGLGLLVDYINRSAALSATLSFPWFVIVAGCLYQKLCKYKTQIILNQQIIKLHKRVCGIFRMVFVICFCTSLCYAGISFHTRQKAWGGGWDGHYMEKTGQSISSSLSDEIMAVGDTVPLFYSMLGWKPKLYVVDIGDMSVDEQAKYELFSKMNAEGMVVMDGYFEGRYPEAMDAWEWVETIPDTEFNIYRHK